MGLIKGVIEILERGRIGGVMLEMFMFLGPVWIALFFGVLIGWAWKPTSPFFNFCPKFNFNGSVSSPVVVANQHGNQKKKTTNLSQDSSSFSSSQLKSDKKLAVTEDDLKHLCHLVERKDSGPTWKHMTDRSAHTMSYQAWQREPATGPPQYCSRTVYEDANPELLQDFFWDDEFRMKWDDMILHAETIQECPTTGTMVVHWVRKFPFFCSDREYIIGRRIWESGRSYYCVTKGVPNDSIARKDKPRRVDLYYSSWFIQAVESKKTGQLNACEVILFHHEDMGIPWEIAKFGIRQGMWGAVKKIERGFRLYQKERSAMGPVSRCAFWATVNSKINPDYIKCLGNEESSEEVQIDCTVDDNKPGCVNIQKALVFGGAVALAFSFDRGLLTKALIFGVARRFGNIGRRL